jgi:hypothetical protein
MTTTLSPEEARQRQDLFGNFRMAAPITRYQWRLEAGHYRDSVTTMPLFKVPIHSAICST